MRYLHRTHRVSVRWLYARFRDTASATMDYELSERMCADIYTKAFTDSVKWEHACDLIGVFTPKRLQAVALMHSENCGPPVSGRGDSAADSEADPEAVPALEQDCSGNGGCTKRTSRESLDSKDNISTSPRVSLDARGRKSMKPAEKKD